LPKFDSAEPRLTVAAFSQRSDALAVKFSDVLGQARGQVFFTSQITDTDATLELNGRISEFIARNRGPKHRVIPLCPLSDEVFAWVGFRELWHRIKDTKSYRFVEGGFTIHLGKQGELFKPQIMRSEWVGRRSKAFGEGIGHPHWQMDVLESVRTRSLEVPARFEGGETPALEFGETQTKEADRDLVLGLTVERMHLASAAQWWRLPSVSIANSPVDAAELDRWILGCITYLRQEMQRCEIVRFS
jgi:hypothetical protein